MKDTIFNPLSGLAVLGVLLLAGLLAAGTGARIHAPVKAPVLLEASEGVEMEAGEKVLAPQQKPRRARAALSMPYFSFAKSLRPGG